MKVVLASCAALPEGDGDEDALIAALVRDGVDVTWQPWGTDVSGADLVVLRATWDYTERLDDFLAWCDGVPALANQVSVVRWNTDKSYLVELAAHGVPVVPTAVVEPGSSPVWPDGEFVVKPAIGAGSRGAARFTSADAAQAHLEALGVKALVQPYQSSVDEHGETALVFFAGEYSHSFHKGPMLAQGLAESESGLYVEEKLRAIEPSAPQLDLANQVLDVAAELLALSSKDFLYARVDVVEGAEGEPLLLELELTEPSLGFKHTGEEAASRLSAAIRSRV
ncbi:RimK family alpha-L-glutamate ligase [Lentzea rhizosphaerae]|uniref:RimK family alpha-L-glutamate ligase n=1 Tax=Lentzea rhizosphaerae TaxID=2041025 RepID=A0ABV8C4H5_9PSEU